jgi:hypothetical protein
VATSPCERDNGRLGTDFLAQRPVPFELRSMLLIRAFVEALTLQANSCASVDWR